jgi:predicted GH43/DUF377 family glycosyl hydrolase
MEFDNCTPTIAPRNLKTPICPYADRMTLRYPTLILVSVLVCLSTTTAIPRASSVVQGQLVLGTSYTGWDSTSVWRPCVVKQGSAFLMWYSGTNDSYIVNIGLATSPDGTSWTRYAENPVLTPGAPGEWDQNSVHDAWVIYDKGKYKMWYSGQIWQSNQLATNQIGYATSLDGIHWTKYGGNPVLSPGPAGSFDDLYVDRPIVVVTGSSYLMFYVGTPKTGNGGRGIATSPDGIRWTRTGQINLPTTAWDIDRQRVTDVIEGQGGFLMAYDGWTGTDMDPTQVGFATSTDGINWTPYPDNPVITGRSSTWDAGGISYPIIVPVNDKYYVYFSAYPANSPTRNIGLAIVPASQYPIPEYASVQFIVFGAVLATAACLALLKRLNRQP